MPSGQLVKIFNETIALARSASSDPINAVRYNPQILQKLTYIEPYFGRRPPVSRIIAPASIESVYIAADGTITPTGDIPITWPRKGRCLGVCGCILEGDPDTNLGRVSFSIKVNGDQNMVIQGLGEGFAPLSALQNGKSDASSYFPLDWPVDTSDRWFVKFTSELPWNPEATDIRLTPKLNFLFEEEGL